MFVFSAEIVQDSDGEECDAINFDPSLPAQHQVKMGLHIDILSCKFSHKGDMNVAVISAASSVVKVS